MSKLAQLGKIVFTKGFKNVSGKTYQAGQFMEAPKEIFGYLIKGRKTPVNKFVNYALTQTAKVINLAKTPCFTTTFGVTAFAAGGIGYLLGNALSDDNNMQGLVVEKEEKKEEKKEVKKKEAKVAVSAKKQTANTEKPVAIVEKSREKNYHPIKTGGLSWATIVTAYYPELVAKHDGQLYGENGAIRELKLALSKDNEKLDLINSSDIPRTLNLPMEINGVKINEKGEAQKVKIKNGGHTDIAEAGKRDSVDVYTIKDKSKNVEITDTDSTTAINCLKKKTGVKEYQVEYTK